MRTNLDPTLGSLVLQLGDLVGEGALLRQRRLQRPVGVSAAAPLPKRSISLPDLVLLDGAIQLGAQITAPQG